MSEYLALDDLDLDLLLSPCTSVRVEHFSPHRPSAAQTPNTHTKLQTQSDRSPAVNLRFLTFRIMKLANRVSITVTEGLAQRY